MYLHYAMHAFGLQVDQLEISVMKEKVPVFDKIFGVFLLPFREDISQL